MGFRPHRERSSIIPSSSTSSSTPIVPGAGGAGGNSSNQTAPPPPPPVLGLTGAASAPRATCTNSQHEQIQFRFTQQWYVICISLRLSSSLNLSRFLALSRQITSNQHQNTKYNLRRGCLSRYFVYISLCLSPSRQTQATSNSKYNLRRGYLCFSLFVSFSRKTQAISTRKLQFTPQRSSQRSISLTVSASFSYVLHPLVQKIYITRHRRRSHKNTRRVTSERNT